MANVCSNNFYAYSEDEQNIEAILVFFTKHFAYYDCDPSDDSLDIYFESSWTFPEELMEELFEAIPNKQDIYMRCLSVEYGMMYHALWYCEEDGWHES